MRGTTTHPDATATVRAVTVKLHERKLGKTDIALSEVALGTWALSGACGRIDESLFKQTIEAALDAGVTTFDTAPIWGESERILGEALREKRDDAVIVTRAGAVLEDGEVRRRFDVASLRADCEASLERMETDRIDVWLLHEPPEDVLLGEEVYELAATLKKEEKIRAFGVTTRGLEEARLAIGHGADAICLPVNLLASDDIEDLDADLSEAGVGVLARSPLCHGLLSGRWTEYRRFADDDHRASRWTPQALAIRVRQVNQLRFLVHDDVPNLASAALRFVLSRPRVTSTIVGARRPAQIAGVQAMVGEPPYIPDEDRVRIGQVLAAAGA